MNRCGLITAGIVATLLGGCATTYQPKGLSGGFSEIALDSTTWRVSFDGNGYSDRGTIEAYLMFRAAELTNEKGFDWFTLNERQGDVESDIFNGQTRINTTALVKMYKGAKPEGRGYAAKEVVATMTPSIKGK
jgi:hypothetical protein